MDLKAEEHASAVADWFLVSYGLANNIIGQRNGESNIQMTYQGAWQHLFDQTGIDYSTIDFRQSRYNNAGHLNGYVNHLYRRVYEQLQNPALVPHIIVGQNFPSPF